MILENAPATLSPVCGARDMWDDPRLRALGATPSAQVKTLLLVPFFAVPLALGSGLALFVPAAGAGCQSSSLLHIAIDLW